MVHFSYNISLPDINECVKDIDDCEHNCTNTEGGYNCTCSDGYISVGSNCSGIMLYVFNYT